MDFLYTLSGIQQMPYGVLCSADIQIDLTPVVRSPAITKRLIIMRIHIAEEIPG